MIFFYLLGLFFLPSAFSMWVSICLDDNYRFQCPSSEEFIIIRGAWIGRNFTTTTFVSSPHCYKNWKNLDFLLDVTASLQQQCTSQHFCDYHYVVSHFHRQHPAAALVTATATHSPLHVEYFCLAKCAFVPPPYSAHFVSPLPLFILFHFSFFLAEIKIICERGSRQMSATWGGYFASFEYFISAENKRDWRTKFISHLSLPCSSEFSLIDSAIGNRSEMHFQLRILDADLRRPSNQPTCEPSSHYDHAVITVLTSAENMFNVCLTAANTPWWGRQEQGDLLIPLVKLTPRQYDIRIDSNFELLELPVNNLDQHEAKGFLLEYVVLLCPAMGAMDYATGITLQYGFSPSSAFQTTQHSSEHNNLSDNGGHVYAQFHCSHSHSYLECRSWQFNQEEQQQHCVPRTFVRVNCIVELVNGSLEGRWERDDWPTKCVFLNATLPPAVVQPSSKLPVLGSVQILLIAFSVILLVILLFVCVCVKRHRLQASSSSTKYSRGLEQRFFTTYPAEAKNHNTDVPSSKWTFWCWPHSSRRMTFSNGAFQDSGGYEQAVASSTASTRRMLTTLEDDTSLGCSSPPSSRLTFVPESMASDSCSPVELRRPSVGSIGSEKSTAVPLPQRVLNPQRQTSLSSRVASQLFGDFFNRVSNNSTLLKVKKWTRAGSSVSRQNSSNAHAWSDRNGPGYDTIGSPNRDRNDRVLSFEMENNGLYASVPNHSSIYEYVLDPQVDAFHSNLERSTLAVVARPFQPVSDPHRVNMQLPPTPK